MFERCYRRPYSDCSRVTINCPVIIITIILLLSVNCTIIPHATAQRPLDTWLMQWHTSFTEPTAIFGDGVCRAQVNFFEDQTRTTGCDTDSLRRLGVAITEYRVYICFCRRWHSCGEVNGQWRLVIVGWLCSSKRNQIVIVNSSHRTASYVRTLSHWNRRWWVRSAMVRSVWHWLLSIAVRLRKRLAGVVGVRSDVRIFHRRSVDRARPLSRTQAAHGGPVAGHRARHDRLSGGRRHRQKQRVAVHAQCGLHQHRLLELLLRQRARTARWRGAQWLNSGRVIRLLRRLPLFSSFVFGLPRFADLFNC